MTVIIKNKLVYNGKTTGYTVCADGNVSRLSIHEAVKMVHTATCVNVVIVHNKNARLMMNDNHIKARLRHSHLRAKSGQLPIEAVTSEL